MKTRGHVMPMERIALGLLFLLAADCTIAQTSQDLKVNDTIPLDPQVLYGKLANGFTYYIRNNTEPTDKVCMYLTLKAGSINEDEDQLGLAHFLEHMAFNGTTHYQRNSMIEYLESSGVRFGVGLNAITDYDATTYKLMISPDNAELMQNGLQIMRDFAQEFLLEPEAIDSERGVVMGELRYRIMNAEGRMRNQYYPRLMNNSRYAFRSTFGTANSITNFKHESLARFYRDWYRPDLQALIIVGNIDVEIIERHIKKLFSDLREPGNVREIEKYPASLTGKNSFMTVTDEEQADTRITMYIKTTSHDLVTVGDVRFLLITQLYNEMMSSRFARLTQQYTPPILEGYSYMDDIIKGADSNLDALQTSVLVDPEKIESGFKTMIREIRRVEQSGFTMKELAEAKKVVAKAFQTAAKGSSRDLADAYVHHFLTAEFAPSPEYWREMMDQLTQEIGLEELNSEVKKWIKEVDRDIVILAPEKIKGNLPDEATVMKWVDEVNSSKIEPYTEYALPESILDSVALKHVIAKGHASKAMTYATGATTVNLPNGVKVILKPTKFDPGRITLHGFSAGGTSTYQDGDCESAQYATAVVRESGVGPFNKFELARFLSEKKIRVSPYINDRAAGIEASVASINLEDMLQVIYAYFMLPNKNELALTNYLSVRRKNFKGTKDPQAALRDTINAFYGNGHKLKRREPGMEELEKAFEIYKDRFANAGDFKFVLVGDFNSENIISLLEKYLGALSTRWEGKTRMEKEKYYRKDSVTKIVYAGQEDKARVEIFFPGTYKYNVRSNVSLRALEQLLSPLITKRLREKEGGVYYVTVSVQYCKCPTGQYSYAISFDCAPNEVHKLIAATFEEVAYFKKMGPSVKAVQNFIESEKKEVERKINDNDFWLNYLVDQCRNDADFDEILHYKKILDVLTPEILKGAASKYLEDENLQQFILLPENYVQTWN